MLGQVPVGDQWIVHAELQPRWNDDISQRDQVLLRGGLGRRLGSRASVWGGYGYIPRWASGDVLHEHRIWQQFSATLPRAGGWTQSLRLRQEQRILEQWGDTSHRFRALGRLVRPIGSGPWSVAVWDEYFVTLDDTLRGPARGFDQNRLFLTALRKLSPSVTLEGGYLWQLVPASQVRGTRHGHTLFTWVNWTPPRR